MFTYFHSHVSAVLGLPVDAVETLHQVEGPGKIPAYSRYGDWPVLLHN